MSLTMIGQEQGHSILRYQREDGNWRRCDPKWEKRTDEESNPIFFRYNPKLRELFYTEKRPLLHGGIVLRNKQTGAFIIDDQTNGPAYKEFDQEDLVRSLE